VLTGLLRIGKFSASKRNLDAAILDELRRGAWRRSQKGRAAAVAISLRKNSTLADFRRGCLSAANG
jgi:hypothetical protein